MLALSNTFWAQPRRLRIVPVKGTSNLGWCYVVAKATQPVRDLPEDEEVLEGFSSISTSRQAKNVRIGELVAVCPANIVLGLTTSVAAVGFMLLTQMIFTRDGASIIFAIFLLAGLYGCCDYWEKGLISAYTQRRLW